MLGIDFGSSNCAAAIVQSDGSLRPIALDGGQTSMPSALYFDGGPVRFGSAAPLYPAGGSSALVPLVAASRAIFFPQAALVEGDRAGGVAAGLAWHAASLAGQA